MGKKKDERKRREREAEQGPVSAHGCAGDNAHSAGKDGKDNGEKHAGRTHDAPTPFAGIAAAVARQLATPAGRQVVAAGLTMAAAAISRHDMKGADRVARPAPPEPRMPPETPISPKAVSPEAGAKLAADQPASSPYAGDTPEPPRGELPPEMAKVMGAVTAGLETLFAGFGKPRNGPPKN